MRNHETKLYPFYLNPSRYTFVQILFKFVQDSVITNIAHVIIFFYFVYPICYVFSINLILNFNMNGSKFYFSNYKKVDHKQNKENIVFTHSDLCSIG